MNAQSAEKRAPLLCRLRLHNWSITTYPIGVRWCYRCNLKDQDSSGYDPAMIALLTRVKPPVECDGCLCPTEHDGDYGSSGHAGPCPPHTCVTSPGVGA